MKYWQQTIDGGEVLMDTKGKIYKTNQYKIEYRPYCMNTVYVEHCKEENLEAVIKRVKDWVVEHDDRIMPSKIKKIIISNPETKEILKEFHRISNDGDMLERFDF